MKSEDKLKHYLEKIKKEDKKINSFLHLNEKALEEAKEIDEKSANTGKKGRLYGYIIAVKSNINVKGMIANCASKVLENYTAPYDATVIEKIKAEDGLIIGMTNMDEFAAGSSGENSAFGATQNPSAPGYITGGSSSGSAAAVAAGFCDIALGSDTGGSIRNPSAYCGVIGVKPSYGLVSRYGLIDLSMSLDQIGLISKNIEDASLLLEVIRGKDEKDTTTFTSQKIELKNPGKIKAGIIKIKGVNKKIESLIEKTIQEKLKKIGYSSQETEIMHINLAVQTYYPIVYSEFYSATRRFDGRRFGFKIEDKCGPEVLRRILGGKEITKAEFSGRYYKKALEVKEMLKNEFIKAFKSFDCLILSAYPVFPWKVGSGSKMNIEEIYTSDALTIPANLAGICALSLPAGKVKYEGKMIPVGMQVMCAHGEDAKMLSIAKALEHA